MNDDVEPETPEELRRAQRRQIHAIGASVVSVVAVVAATAFGVHAWRGSATPHADVLRSADVAASDQPLSSAPATSQSAATITEFASSASPAPVDSLSADPSASPSPSARPTAPSIDSNVSGNGQVDLKLTMTASPTRVEFGQPVRVTLTIVNAGRVYAHTGQLGVGTMRPNDTFNEVPRACDEPQEDGVWCSVGVLRPGQKVSLAFSITPASAPFSDDQVFADIEYLDNHGQQQDEQVSSPELTVIDDPGNLLASPMTSPAPPSLSPSSTASPAGASSMPPGSASPSVTPSAS
jgi:hypothetical protein